LGTLLFIYLFLYLKAPYTHRDFFPNIRYAMPLLLLGVCGIGFLVEKLSFIKKTFFLFATMVFIFSFLFLIFSPPESISYTDRIFLNYSILLKYKSVLFIFLVAIMTFYYAFQILSSDAKRAALKYTIAGLLIVLSFFSTYKFFEFAYRERELLKNFWTSSYFGKDQTLMDIIQAAEWLNQNAPTSKIAYSGFNFHYYLYGRNFSREVDYVNINECTDCRYSDYRNSEHSIRRNPNYNHWFQNLAKEKKEYFVVNPAAMKEVRSYEFEWVHENSENFEKVFNSNDVSIYKISYD
jgi:hypothetical protein